jgi:galactose mutarotase-like enzyme
MYPWVNRLEVYPKAEFKDGAGLPLHGLYATRKRNLTRTQTSDSIILELTCESFHFKEIFTLTANSLSIEFQLISESKQEIVCFGYHPYLQLNNVKLTNQNVRF